MPRLILLLMFVLCCFAQSRNDWRLPVQYGTTVPSTCEGGKIFIKTNASAGSNTYACVSGSYVLQGGTAGNSTTTGSFANNPGSCTDGDLRLPDDSAYILRCASNVWVQWGTVMRSYNPALASITTTRNFGSSTAVTTRGGIVLTVPAGSGTQVRGIEKDVPTAPYTVTASFNALIMNQDYMTCGVYLSDETKLVSAALAYSSFVGTAGPIIRLGKWNSVTSFLGDYLTTYATAGMFPNGNLTIKINDDNTNRITSVCLDPSGNDCMQLHSVSRTDHLTPTKIGIFCNTENTTYPAKIWLKSWREQ
jgi:hypothetical protein